LFKATQKLLEFQEHSADRGIPSQNKT